MITTRHYKKLREFVKSIRFSNARSLLSFDLKLYPVRDVDGYIDLLAHLPVREVRVEAIYGSLTLPRSLYNKFLTLNTLILERLSLVDVPCTQLRLRLRFLKTLHLLSVKFSDDESVQRLLRSCPVLEDLVVRRTTYVNVIMFTINVPTLRSLSIDYSGTVSPTVGVHGFVINASSLRYLNIRDYLSSALRFGHMPELVKANVDVQYDKILGSLSSVRHFSLCSKTSKIPCHAGTFLFLEHLELCTCSPLWWNLLKSILKDAPKLQVLKLRLKHCVRYEVPLLLRLPKVKVFRAIGLIVDQTVFSRLLVAMPHLEHLSIEFEARLSSGTFVISVPTVRILSITKSLLNSLCHCVEIAGSSRLEVATMQSQHNGIGFLKGFQ